MSIKLSRKHLRQLILNEIRQVNEMRPGAPRFDLDKELMSWFNSLRMGETEPGQKLQQIDGMLKKHRNYDRFFERATETPRKDTNSEILRRWYDSLGFKMAETDPHGKLSSIKSMLEQHKNYDFFFGK